MLNKRDEIKVQKWVLISELNAKKWINAWMKLQKCIMVWNNETLSKHANTRQIFPNPEQTRGACRVCRPHILTRWSRPVHPAASSQSKVLRGEDNRKLKGLGQVETPQSVTMITISFKGKKKNHPVKNSQESHAMLPQARCRVKMPHCASYQWCSCAQVASNNCNLFIYCIIIIISLP